MIFCGPSRFMALLSRYVAGEVIRGQMFKWKPSHTSVKSEDTVLTNNDENEILINLSVIYEGELAWTRN